jgi:hypothetical protein
MHTYARLLRHRWRRFQRGSQAGPGRVKRWILGFFGVYIAGSLAACGWVYYRIVGRVQPGTDPVAVANGLMLSAAVALLVLRFFTQRSTSMKMAPYLARPVPRKAVVRFVQASSLASLLNVFAPAFLVPLWYRSVLGGPFGAPAPEAWAWLAAVGMLVLFTHYANNALRLLLAQNVRAFAWLAATGGALLVADRVAGTRLVPRASIALFGGLLDGQFAWLAVPAGLLAAAWGASGHLLRRSLRRSDGGEQAGAATVPAAFARRRGATRNLMLLELKLIARNRRPFTLVGISALLIVTYGPLLLVGRDLFSVIDAVTGLFATGLLAASYGQLMFAWESRHFDGLQARPIRPRTRMRAKLLLLQCGCVASLLVAGPFFVWLAPDLLLLSAGFLLYNLGITCPFVLFFSLWNRERLAPQRSGFFNYEGLSVQHWIGSLPVFVPPLVLALALSEAWLLAGVSVVGLLGMALGPTWTRAFARLFSKHRHAMGTGFRRGE